MVAYFLMLLVIFILPFWSVESYSMIRNTTSQLGAQNAPYAWVMNAVFILLGLGSILSGWKYLEGFSLHRALLLFFGISLILSAFFHPAPIGMNSGFDLYQDHMHSVFASTAGIGFTLLAISSAFILRSTFDRIIAFAMGIWASLLPILIFLFPETMGIWQRILFITTFGWLIYLFWGREKR